METAMPDLSPENALSLIALLACLAAIGLLAHRMDCRARRRTTSAPTYESTAPRDQAAALRQAAAEHQARLARMRAAQAMQPPATRKPELRACVLPPADLGERPETRSAGDIPEHRGNPLGRG